MPIETSIVINEVGWVSHDYIGAPFNSSENVAENRPCGREIVECRVYDAEGQRLSVNVGEKKLGASSKQSSCKDASRSASGTDVDKSDGFASL